MSKKAKVVLSVFGVMCLWASGMLAYAPTNFHKPYDINFRMEEWKGTRFQAGASFEYGTTSKCRDWDENKVGVLRLYSPSESALTMLLGAQRGSDIYNLANRLLPAFAPGTDDGRRGRFLLDGEFEGLDLNFWGKYKLPIEKIPGNFDLYWYLLKLSPAQIDDCSLS